MAPRPMHLPLPQKSPTAERRVFVTWQDSAWLPRVIIRSGVAVASRPSAAARLGARASEAALGKCPRRSRLKACAPRALPSQFTLNNSPFTSRQIL